MTDFLRRAGTRVLAGEDKKALDDLRVAEPDLRVRGDSAGLESLVALAQTIRDRNEGRVRDQAEALMRDVTQTLAALAPVESRLTNTGTTPTYSSSLDGWVTFSVAGFGLAAVLSLIGGLVIAIDDGVPWLVAGFVFASLWVGSAVLLLLVRDIAAGIAALVDRKPE